MIIDIVRGTEIDALTHIRYYPGISKIIAVGVEIGQLAYFSGLYNSFPCSHRGDNVIRGGTVAEEDDCGAN